MSRKMSARYDYPFQYREKKLVGRGWWYWLRSKVCNGLPKVGPRNLKQKVMTGREKKLLMLRKIVILTHVGVVLRMCKIFRAKLEGSKSAVRWVSGVLQKNVCYLREHELCRLVTKFTLYSIHRS